MSLQLRTAQYYTAETTETSRVLESGQSRERDAGPQLRQISARHRRFFGVTATRSILLPVIACALSLLHCRGTFAVRAVSS
jgi:hypothetical protein